MGIEPPAPEEAALLALAEEVVVAAPPAPPAPPAAPVPLALDALASRPEPPMPSEPPPLPPVPSTDEASPPLVQPSELARATPKTRLANRRASAFTFAVSTRAGELVNRARRSRARAGVLDRRVSCE